MGGLLILFVLCSSTTILSYYDKFYEPAVWIGIAFDEIAIIPVALILALSCPISMILAFRSSPNDFDTFTMELYAISCIASFLTVTIGVPIEIEHPSYVDDSLATAWVVLIIATMTTCQLLRKDFWRMARREDHEP